MGRCISRKYLKNLPSTSIIIIFKNELWNLLIRCLHSVYNRTPHKLLKEIILVDDASEDKRLGEPLKKYVSENFGEVVFNFLRNNESKGLVVTRMNGAKAAKGEAIVFLDSHMEVKKDLFTTFM